ncbi:MAG: 50S ribosomal protein L11 methyltransferase [Acetobacteraceae bacterium]|nr:50S ribosomal protein L11 methyltransferase [Acetobacteraceae bacterium]
MRRRAGPLETVSVEVPEEALEIFEAALLESCDTVSFFLSDEERKIWQVEGVRDVPEDDSALRHALALATAATGVDPVLVRSPTEADGWLARTQEAFPDQLVGRRFLVRGTHSETTVPGRHTLTLDAGLAFGSGEHGSTRGCLRALEVVARRRPRRVLDLGTGSGILAMAAAKLLHRPVLATDIEPWSVRVARENAWRNGVGRAVRVELADGWSSPVITRAAPFDLVLANILARPLCRMAGDLAAYLAPCGSAILAGLLREQVRTVLAAHQRHGLRLERVLTEGNWATLMLRAGG